MSNEMIWGAVHLAKNLSIVLHYSCLFVSLHLVIMPKELRTDNVIN